MSRVELDFNGHYRCESRAEGERWLRDLIGAALEKAVAKEGEGYDALSAYAFCPLCGQGVSDYYRGYRGFSFPIGLERHLEGWGNQQQCPVLKAAAALAREHWHEKFSPAEAQARRVEHDQQLERRRSEDLYVVDPRRDPLLLDENCYIDGCRSSEPDDAFGLTWAVRRLESLGLRRVVSAKRAGTGELVAFVDQQPDYAVYGDPRAKGRVRFVVVKLKNGKPAPQRGRSDWATTRFEFQDRWKNDLQRKYREQLGLALKALGLEPVGPATVSG